MHPMFTDIGSYIKTVVSPYAAAATSSAANGAAVQLEGIGYSYKSAQITLTLGAATGTPTGISVVAQVQQSADGSTNWTSYTDLYSHGTLTGTAASTSYSQNVILQGAQQFVRLVTTPTLTGGSSPTIATQGVMVLGGSSENPAI
jgi:hypothetical protein